MSKSEVLVSYKEEVGCKTDQLCPALTSDCWEAKKLLAREIKTAP